MNEINKDLVISKMTQMVLSVVKPDNGSLDPELVRISIERVYSAYRPDAYSVVVSFINNYWRFGVTDNQLTIRRKVIGNDFNKKGLLERIETVFKDATYYREMSAQRDKADAHQREKDASFRSELETIGLLTNQVHSVRVMRIDGVKRRITLESLTCTPEQMVQIIKVMES